MTPDTPDTPDQPTRPAGAWYTTTEAAALLALTPWGVQQAIKRGTLRSTLIHPRLRVITPEELDRYRRDHLGKIGTKRPKT